MNDRRILICYDGSDGARRAVTTAAQLFPDCRAVVLDIAPNLIEVDADEVVTGANAGVALAREAGLTAEARAVVAASTWRGIVEIAEDIDAVVIVTGSRGLSGLREFFEGSVSHNVAQHAGRPVLIVPPAHP